MEKRIEKKVRLYIGYCRILWFWKENKKQMEKKKRKVGEEEKKWLSVGLEDRNIGVGNVFLDGILTDEAHDIFFFSGHLFCV